MGGRKPKTEKVKAKEEPEKKIPRKIPLDSSTSSEESVEMELASKVPPQASKTKNVSVSSEDEVMIKVVPPRRFDNKIIKENKGKNKEVKSNEGNEVPQTKKAKFSKVSDIFRPSPKPDMDLSRIDQKAPTRSKESSTPSKQVESSMKRKNADIEKPLRLKEVDMFGSLEPTLKKMKKSKPKTPKAVSKSKESSKPSSSNLQQEKVEKGRKSVSWAAPHRLVKIKYFEVDEDEGSFKRRFDRLDMKIDKMNEIASSRKPPPPTVKPQKPWSALQPLEGLTKELKMYESLSEEKRVQKLRESQTLPVYKNPCNSVEVLENTSEVDVLSKSSRCQAGTGIPIIIPLHGPQDKLSDFSYSDWPALAAYSTTAGFKSFPNVVLQKGFKTVACRFFIRGYCKWGDKCTYLHNGK